MKTIIHVNQHVVKANAKSGSREPVLTCKTYKENNYAHTVAILDAAGNEVARVVYSPDKPLSCGAKVWIETTNKVSILK
jgi:nucleoside-diphosphate-sugar epimerase